MFIPDPNFSTLDLGKKHPGSGTAPKQVFLPLKTVSKLSEIWSGMFIPDPDFFPVPDPGVKEAPDPGSGSATLMTCFSVPTNLGINMGVVTIWVLVENCTILAWVPRYSVLCQYSVLDAPYLNKKKLISKSSSWEWHKKPTVRLKCTVPHFGIYHVVQPIYAFPFLFWYCALFSCMNLSHGFSVYQHLVSAAEHG